MKRPETGYTKSMDLLVQRFKERHDAQNALHRDLQIRLNDLTGQLHALETIRQTALDPLNVGRAAGRLRLIAEEAQKAITSKAQEAAASFESALREHSRLTPGPFGAEIRARLHAMKPGERVKAIQAMIESKDGSSLAGIVDAPSMLTGLSAEDLGKFRDQFYRVAVPELVQARDTFRDLAEHLQTAIKTAMSAASEYSDPRKLRELEEREAEAAKAQEALNG